MGHYCDVLSGSLQAFFNPMRRAHWYRCHQDQNLTVITVIGNLHGDRFHVPVCVFRQIDDFGALHHRLQMRGIHEPPGANAAADNVT